MGDVDVRVGIQVAGEAVYYFQINLNLTERTNAKKVIWK